MRRRIFARPFSVEIAIVSLVVIVLIQGFRLRSWLNASSWSSGAKLEEDANRDVAVDSPVRGIPLAKPLDTLRPTSRPVPVSPSKGAPVASNPLQNPRHWRESQELKERLVSDVLSEDQNRRVPHSEARNAIRALWKHEWTSFEWVSNPDVILKAAERQERFLADPAAFRPQPVVYRPILGGMGWGNLMYDISHHVIFALMLERPLLIMFDKKDAFGKLGWDAKQQSTSVFHWRVFDWRWGGKDALLTLYDPGRLAHRDDSSHEMVTCRKGYAFHDRCGGDQDKGNFEPLLAYFRNIPEKPLYSEYSASFIRPLQNAPSFHSWIRTNVKDSERVLATQLRFAFNILFQVNTTFYETKVFPHLTRLTNRFTSPFATVHIRTGHMETGVERLESLASDERSLRQCQALYKPNMTWLVLTDNAELALRMVNSSYVTVGEAFSLAKYHVGYSQASYQGDAWEISLRDWLLLVESTGPVMLRSRMPTAFSFGQRGAFIGGMHCRKPTESVELCANRFFDEVCAHI